MKKHILVLCCIAFMTVPAFAKKVRFSVDLGTDTSHTIGVHITGDFQLAAGFNSDWCSDCTIMTEIGTSNVFTLVVDIPAFQKYEFKYINGDQFYDAEFVPEESRVGYSFNDNRWIYVDSTANDTTFMGAVRFSGNAPTGKNLVRFYVDMQNEIVSSKGVHVAGSFQSWNTKRNTLYHFIDAAPGIYETIDYVTASTYQYKFYNGNTTLDAEIVPTNCATSGNRSVAVSSDTLLNQVCYSSCSACLSIGIAEMQLASAVTIYPNPTTDVASIEFKDANDKVVVITDARGRVVRSYYSVKAKTLQIQKENLVAGMYYVNVRFSDNSISKAKFIFE